MGKELYNIQSCHSSACNRTSTTPTHVPKRFARAILSVQLTCEICYYSCKCAIYCTPSNFFIDKTDHTVCSFKHLLVTLIQKSIVDATHLFSFQRGKIYSKYIKVNIHLQKIVNVRFFWGGFQSTDRKVLIPYTWTK